MMEEKAEERTEDEGRVDRVKVYCLNELGQWDDLGTGNVSFVTYNDGSTGLRVLKKDSSGEQLLSCFISMEDIYSRQGESIITWNEPSKGHDVALSFADADGCQDIWVKICGAQGRYISYFNNQENEVDSPASPIINGENVFSAQSEVSMHIELPAAEIENLGVIAEFIANFNPVNAISRNPCAYSIMENDFSYLKRLFAILKDVDDLDDENSLIQLFLIFKNMLLLNHSELIDALLSDDFWLQLMQALESDPELPSRALHLKYLQDEVVFNQIVPITNKKILHMIHQNFRIMYLKDVVLPRTLDDPSMSTLNSLLFFNNVEIVTGLYEDESFLVSLFEKLHFALTESSILSDVLSFIQEMCNLAKTLQPAYRQKYFTNILQEKFNLLPSLEAVLANDTFTALTHTRSIEILINMVVHDAKFIRSYMGKILKKHQDISQKNIYLNGGGISETNGTLLFLIFRRMLVDVDAGVQAQAAELIKLFLDPEGMDSADKDDFLENYYNTYIRWLVYPFTRPEEYVHVIDPSIDRVAKLHVCEVLSFCVTSHGYRAKYFIFKGNICSRVIQLLNDKEKHLVLVGLRFIKACITLKDEFYNRFIIKNDFFRPVFEVFKKHAHKNNMINSAILDLIQFIGQESIKSLGVYLVENFLDTLQKISYAPSFSGFIDKFQNFAVKPIEENTKGISIINEKQQMEQNRKRMYEEEEAYFDGDDDEDDSEMNNNTANSNKADSLNMLSSYTDEEEEDREREKIVESNSPTLLKRKYPSVSDGEDSFLNSNAFSKEEGGQKRMKWSPK